MLASLLDVSVRNNLRDRITGVLLYHDLLFFQVLEGQRPAVERCYERIENDQRHSGVSLIWSHPVETRVFSQWAMGFAGPEEIGAHTRQAVRPVADVLRGKGPTPAANPVALRLARLMYLDFKGAA